ncbi:TPA: hypothetical protein J6O31_002924 [Escherichia coli]|uniref:hypothetical protein n=1 Tax=Escherichia coli TaxID=562 RepID=UPI0007752243|nr:hypothetical protein [Escherichia coli]EEW7495307.1 hypothetical protein [Escherichia albertii]EEX4920920.1 hypothetical protein [Escherichia albertii]EFC4784131.1 hypothetical protein [Escherichia coli]EFD0482126.1 hypothetical protein [Escherichia coli]EFH5366527.1 hypothetical protein [Escherichia coli]
MINAISVLISTIMSVFTKTKLIEKEEHRTNTEGQIETNKIEIEQNTFHWRNFLGFVLSLIILYNWIIVPVLDAFGIVLIQVPLGELLQILLIMVGGG